ncbi:MAG: hypothetical protein DRJ05_06210 [Bacteroidetes bacterium]|nr:MAG: hypothetical protein DRJ05_06210 [Bacteroidota bacterium]
MRRLAENTNVNVRYIIVVFLFLGRLTIFGQDDLLDLFDEQPTTEYTYATFKTTRIINAQSIENPAKGTLIFLIQHRFGRLNTGAYNFFGLDQSTIRLGFEYGVTDRLAIGIGRSSHLKTFDGFIKYKILRQSTGLRKMPISLTYYGSTDLTSLKWEDMGVEDRTNYFSSRMAFTHQLLVTRKFSNRFSLQLMPTLVHKNLVKYEIDKNNIYSLGLGSRIKITNRTAINLEYFFVFPDQIHTEYDNSLSLGFDIETGGHVFQLVFTNSRAIYDSGYITDTQGSWLNGDIYFGFNISRVFTVVKPKTFK